MNVRAILLDIEGTTTPISFVFDVLFPYARKNLTSYLEQNSDSPEVLADLAALRQDHTRDVNKGHQPPNLIENGIVEYAYWLMDHNSKSTALKSLQGKIWQKGYKEGDLVAPVFQDVPPAMERWHAGIQVSIFSSGSVLAQQLLFSHTDEGDLTRFISNYFDTEVGKKTDPASYGNISRSLSLATAQIHFISDVPAELDAANDAGMKTTLCIRPGNEVQEPSARHQTIRTFTEL